MSPLGPEQILDASIPAKAKLAAWAVNQGVTVVLLFALLIGIYVRVPQILATLQAGYEKNAIDLQAAAARYEATAERLLVVIEKHAKNPVEIPAKP